MGYVRCIHVHYLQRVTAFDWVTSMASKGLRCCAQNGRGFDWAHTGGLQRKAAYSSLHAGASMERRGPGNIHMQTVASPPQPMSSEMLCVFARLSCCLHWRRVDSEMDLLQNHGSRGHGLMTGDLSLLRKGDVPQTPFCNIDPKAGGGRK